MRSSFLAMIRLPSLPETPTARPPAALMPLTICLLIEPVSTISTTLIAASSVTRRPSMKVDGIDRRLQHVADLRAAAMDDHGLDARLLHQHDVLREILGHAFDHGVAAIFHDDGLAVVLQDVGQRFDENARGRAPARHHAQIAVLGDVVLKRHGSDFAGRGALYRKAHARSQRGEMSLQGIEAKAFQRRCRENFRIGGGVLFGCLVNDRLRP